MKKRYIFFDIDGTLKAGGYHNEYIPESTKLAISKLREAGHFLCIATGRSHAMAKKFMEELDFKNMVSDGGFGITINGEVLDIKPLPKQSVIELVDECEKLGFAWALQLDDSDTRVAPDRRFEEFTHDVYMKTRIEEGLDVRECGDVYKVYVACLAPEEQKLESLKALPWCRFLEEYIFVEPADKAHGVRWIMDYYGADYADAIVFGDGINDLSMFVDSWTKVAMGNACEELKACADYITTDVDKDGIWNACLELSLFEA